MLKPQKYPAKVHGNWNNDKKLMLFLFLTFTGNIKICAVITHVQNTSINCIPLPRLPLALETHHGWWLSHHQYHSSMENVPQRPTTPHIGYTKSISLLYIIWDCFGRFVKWITKSPSWCQYGLRMSTVYWLGWLGVAWGTPSQGSHCWTSKKWEKLGWLGNSRRNS